MSAPDRGPLNVALVEAPFGPALWPSIGTGLLKAQLNRSGVEASVVYANHFLLGMMGPADRQTLTAYQDISDAFGTHLGEWIFVDEAFPEARSPSRDAEFLSELGRDGASPSLVEAARRVRGLTGAFLDRTMARVDWAAYDVVGFANTFSQLNASIALARRLRVRWPHLRFIIGGAGCSDDMGLGVAKTSELFSAVALGEADEIVVDLCRAVAADDETALSTIPGIAYRRSDGSIARSPPKERVRRMDELPEPVYDDYYATLPTGYRRELPFYLPIEASRGCWWGAKHHCTFCGLNPDRMSHHAKSPDRFLAEVESLARKYEPTRFMAVDNIMPREFYDEVAPRLKARSGGVEFFFEVKANFRKEQLATFGQARILQIQPGIESLSSHVLKLMKKGITGPANIMTLRLCEEFGLRAHWSILHGFHGETADDYRTIAELARRLTHLRAPLGLFQAEVERFAPMFRFPEAHGLANLRPSHWYRYCYPVPEAVLKDLAYRFDAEPVDRDPEAAAVIFGELAPLVAAWRDAYGAGESRLDLVLQARGAQIERAFQGVRTRYRLSARAHDVYVLFDRPQKPERILGLAQATTPPTPYLDPAFGALCAQLDPDGGEVEIDAADPAEIYHQLLVHGLVIQEEGLALAVARQVLQAVEPAVPAELVMT